MSTFNLEIYSHDRMFLKEETEALVCNGVDGEICILKDHIPMIMALDIGILRIKINGEWQTAVSDAGFGEVKNNIVRIFVSEIEWAQNLEFAKSEIARLRKEEKEREQKSLREYKRNIITLTRTVAELGKKNYPKN